MIDTAALLANAKPYPCGGEMTGSYYWLHPVERDTGPGTLPAEVCILLECDDRDIVSGIHTYPTEAAALDALRAAVAKYEEGKT